jgi:hypothetical protein
MLPLLARSDRLYMPFAESELLSSSSGLFVSTKAVMNRFEAMASFGWPVAGADLL